ncbi:MAG: hypothetical protein JW850_02935 [Thermoflexales bacterium]|nr:hypothetical protein [Thermoflexales bacterium]
MIIKPTCAISGRFIGNRDDVAGFPAFVGDPRDPHHAYSDASALRDEFEAWELRDDIAKRVKAHWSAWYRQDPVVYTVIFEDDDYLLVENKVAAAARIVFHRHVFALDVPHACWLELCDKLAGAFEAGVDSGSFVGGGYELVKRLLGLNVIEFNPYPNTVLLFKEHAEFIEIQWRNRIAGQDRIRLSRPEWAAFQAVLVANKTLF